MNSKLFLPIILLYVFSGCAQRPNSSPVVSSLNTNEARSNQNAAAPTPSPSPTPRDELPLNDGLRIVRKNVKMENKDWRYQINVDYPQIEGTNNLPILNLNRQIKRLITKTYSWPLSRPTKKDLLYYAKWPDAFNTVDIEYDIVLASDELLSIYFIGYHYGIGAAHSVHESFTVNYDFKSHRRLILADLFKPGAKYLQIISRRCRDDLSKEAPYLKTDSYFSEGLMPKSKNFQSWNITKEGLRINFDACKVNACAAGDLSVEIPLDRFDGVVKPNGPLSRIVAHNKALQLTAR